VTSSRQRSLATYLSFVKFEHTLFALPFAYGGMLLAERSWPGLVTFLWITVAMIGARTASMALNRVIDAKIDAKNPRTAAREIPTGRLSRRDGLLLAIIGFGVLLLAAWQLNPLTLALAPLAVAVLSLYPYTKRLTWLCHAWLGLAIGAAAAGGYIAVTGAFTPAAFALWLAVGLWIAGFDVIYAVLDYDFDIKHGIYSIPARFGVQPALKLAALTHLLAWLSFVLVLPSSGSSWPYGLGLLVMAGLLMHQHRLVAKRGVAAALQAFNVNLWIGVAMLAAVIADIALT
jgi:4-hydroxybenzoate polyprenyltransferase